MDRPWRRPGAAHYAVARLAGILDPPVTVVQPTSPMITDLDVPVASRDGTTLRVNCYRPVSDDPVPVLLRAHPYISAAAAARRVRSSDRRTRAVCHAHASGGGSAAGACGPLAVATEPVDRSVPGRLRRVTKRVVHRALGTKSAVTPHRSRPVSSANVKLDLIVAAWLSYLSATARGCSESARFRPGGVVDPVTGCSLAGPRRADVD